MVELVDSLASGASARKGVRVRLPPRAPKRKDIRKDVLSFWVPRAVGPLHPSVIQMLGRNEFALRNSPPPPAAANLRRKSAAGQKAGWVVSLSAASPSKNRTDRSHSAWSVLFFQFHYTILNGLPVPRWDIFDHIV